jgi:hypothetical protein
VQDIIKNGRIKEDKIGGARIDGDGIITLKQILKKYGVRM